MMNGLAGVTLALFAIGAMMVICTIATAMATHRANDYHAAILKELRIANGTWRPAAGQAMPAEAAEAAVLTRTCPSCGVRYGAGVATCPQDGNKLV